MKLGSGGAIYTAPNSSLTIAGTTFTGNAATSTGGAINIDNESSATISNSFFVLNTADSFGGGIYINSSTTANPTTVTLHAVDVNGNRAEFRGGGIFVNSFPEGAGTTLTLKGGTTIQNNVVTTSGGKGGGIYFGMGTINLDGVWIGNNDATQGDGMYRVNGTTKNIGPGGVTWVNDQEFVGPG
jgi:hypothetical protein